MKTKRAPLKEGIRANLPLVVAVQDLNLGMHLFLLVWAFFPPMQTVFPCVYVRALSWVSTALAGLPKKLFRVCSCTSVEEEMRVFFFAACVSDLGRWEPRFRCNEENKQKMADSNPFSPLHRMGRRRHLIFRCLVCPRFYGKRPHTNTPLM